MDRVDFAEARCKFMYLERCSVNWYQENCRIYLDEYEVEEVDLRVNFDTSLLMKRFMKKD